MKASLKRLDVEYVDLVFCHRPDVTTPIEETVRAMNFVIDQGWAFYCERRLPITTAPLLQHTCRGLSASHTPAPQQSPILPSHTTLTCAKQWGPLDMTVPCMSSMKQHGGCTMQGGPASGQRSS